MGLCQSAPPPYYEPEPDPVLPPESPTWKQPPFPAPALPPLTRQNKIIIACSRYCEDEEEKVKTKKCVLNGMGEALSIVFDQGDLLEEFIPEVKKLFSLAMTITSIELHTAQLDIEADFLQSFLDTLPSHGELRAFSLVVARETPLVFASISGLLYRNPGLQALRLWGVDLTPAGTGTQYYPSCKLSRVDLSHVKLHPQQIDNLLGGSKESLLCLKIDKPVGLSGSHIARAVNNYGKKVQMLTIILPEESESEMDQKASYLVGDTASRFPTSLKYLHLGGLAASDNLFTVTPSLPASQPAGNSKTSSSSSEPVMKSHLHQLVALRLDDCPRLTVNGIFACIRQKNMPNLLRLHAYWLENEEAYNDVELWKTFAASEDIKVNLETEGLVWITALKEVATGSQMDPRQQINMPVPPQAAHLQPGQGGARYLLPPGAAVPRGLSPPQPVQAAKSKLSHRSKRSRRRHRRRGSDESTEDSSSEDSDDSSSEDSDDSEYRSARSHRSRSPGGRSSRSRERRHR